MAARQRLYRRVEAESQEFARRLHGKFRQEREAVTAVNHERLLWPAPELVEVSDGADAHPQAPQFVMREDGFEALPDVLRRLAGPDHVAERRGRVIEYADADARIVRAGQKRIARAKTGSDDSQPRVAALLQPVEARADVDNRLPSRMNRAADVG